MPKKWLPTRYELTRLGFSKHKSHEVWYKTFECLEPNAHITLNIKYYANAKAFALEYDFSMIIPLRIKTEDELETLIKIFGGRK